MSRHANCQHCEEGDKRAMALIGLCPVCTADLDFSGPIVCRACGYVRIRSVIRLNDNDYSVECAYGHVSSATKDELENFTCRNCKGGEERDNR